MDIVDVVAVTFGIAFIVYMVYQAMYERNEALRDKIDAEIDKLSR